MARSSIPSRSSTGGPPFPAARTPPRSRAWVAAPRLQVPAPRDGGGAAPSLARGRAAFRATGLSRHEANAHKTRHLHRTVAGLVVAIGRQYGLAARRVRAEPVAPLREAGAVLSLAQRIGARLLALWVALLRWRLTRAGIAVNDHLFGLAWSGAMTEARVLSLLPPVPEGVSEIYFHPAASRR